MAIVTLLGHRTVDALHELDEAYHAACIAKTQREREAAGLGEENSRLCDRIAELEKERDELRSECERLRRSIACVGLQRDELRRVKLEAEDRAEEVSR